jgi:polysaccharide pyruvyl transferase WcaK-like protein
VWIETLGTEAASGDIAERIDMNSAEAKRKNIFLFGNFGTGNIGNECTLQAFLHACRKNIPDAGLTGICTIPEDVSIRHGLHAIPINDGDREKKGKRKRHASRCVRVLLSRLPTEARQWMRAYRSLKSADGLIMAGTGMITDEETGVWGLPYEIMKWTLVAKLRRSKVFFVSVGVERVRHRIAREFFKWALSLADYRSFRDIESKRSLLDLGMRVDEDPVYPDLAYSLPRSVMPDPMREKRQPAVIGVGLLDYFGQGSKEGKGETAYAAYIQKIADFIVWLLEQDHVVRILIGDMTCDNRVRRDMRECIERRGISYDNRRIIDEPIHSVSDLLDQLSKTDMVVASRFHNILLSLMQNRPAISISYNIKNDAIMREYGLGEYCQNIESLDVSRLIEQFRELKESASEHVPRLLEKTEEFRIASDAQCEEIFVRLRQP